MPIPAEFHELTNAAQRRAIFDRLGELMSREAELEVLVAQGTAATNQLRGEIAEMRTSGDAAIGRLTERIGVLVSENAALRAEVAVVREGAVSAEKLAELRATTDAAVAAADASKVAADEAEAAWDGVARPEVPPAE